FQEGLMRGELQLVSVEDLPPSEVVNAIDAVFYPDALQPVTDPHVLKSRKDQRFTGLVTVNESASSSHDAQRPAKAAASQALYDAIRLVERFDLYSAEAPVLHTMLYIFDRYHRLPKRVTVRVPRRDFFENGPDLFAAGMVCHSGIRSKTGAVS